jgi:hypothetical protein
MPLYDDLKKRLWDSLGKSEAGKKVASKAAEKAAEASAAAASKAAEVALDEFADDFEKQLVGDLDEVNEQDARLEARARAAEELQAQRFREVHETRMNRESKAKAELEELKRKMGKK